MFVNDLANDPVRIPCIGSTSLVAEHGLVYGVGSSSFAVRFALLLAPGRFVGSLQLKLHKCATSDMVPGRLDLLPGSNPIAKLVVHVPGDAASVRTCIDARRC